MQALLHAISGVLTLIFMGLIGCYLAKIGWINKDNKALLPKLVTNVSLPLFFIYNITHAFSHDQLLHLITGSIVPFISIGVCFILSVFLARFMSKKGHRGIFQSTFTTSNTIFVGLPVTMALFGEEAIPYTLLYFFANTTFFWTLGNACIQADSKEFSYQQMFTLKTLPTTSMAITITRAMPKSMPATIPTVVHVSAVIAPSEANKLNIFLRPPYAI